MHTTATRAPVDKSMPAVMMTKVTPTAIMPVTEASLRNVNILLGVKKYSLVKLKIRMSNASKPADIKRLILSCLNVFPPQARILLKGCPRQAVPLSVELSRLPEYHPLLLFIIHHFNIHYQRISPVICFTLSGVTTIGPIFTTGVSSNWLGSISALSANSMRRNAVAP